MCSSMQRGGSFNSRLREEATEFVETLNDEYAVSTHASVRRRLQVRSNSLVSESFQLTPP